MSGRVVWITGISGSGKTTLANALLKRLAPQVKGILVDGDQIRTLFADDLGFCEASRHIQIGRLQRLAQWLGNQGHFVVVAALYSHPELLAWNRNHLPGYFEIYLNLPLGLVRARDPKGLYDKAARGAVPHVVGIDIPWHEPRYPDLVIGPGEIEDPDLMAAKLIAKAPGWLGME